MPITLFHAFNWSFVQTEASLAELATKGFDGVQISPAQKSFPVSSPDAEETLPWFMRYQPYDYSAIQGLGGEAELRALCEEAKNQGLLIVADLVFNHMGAPYDARKASWLAGALQAGGKARAEASAFLSNLLSSYPQFGPEDFHPFKAIDGADYDRNELRYDGWGGAGTWPDLRPTERVLGAQKQHIQKLHNCGVRGFRFDAVKQLYPEKQYFPLVDFCRSLGGVDFVYGEVLSTNPRMHAEYAAGGLTTDFQLMQLLVESFEGSESVLWPDLLAYPVGTSVVFARNHDTVMQHLPTLSFTDSRRAALAGAFVLAARAEAVLVFGDDLYSDPFAAPCRSALAFRRVWSETEIQPRPSILRASQQSEALSDSRNTAEVLCLEIEGRSALLFNASNQHVRLGAEALGELSKRLKVPLEADLAMEAWSLRLLENPKP